MKYNRDHEVFFRSSRPGRNLRPLLIGVFLLFVIFSGSAVVQGLSSPVLYLAYPLFNIAGQAENNLNNIGGFLRGAKALLEANANLRSQNEFLTEENLILKERVKNYDELMGVISTSTLAKRLPARVISKPNRSPYDTLLIATTGGKNLFKPGALIFSSGGVVLGEIDQVYDFSARAILFSTPGKKLSVEVGEEHTLATAEGQGGGNFKIVLPRGVDIRVGDKVVAPTISTDLLGVVGLVDSKPQNPFQTVYFKSPLNLYELVWIFINR